MARWSSNKYSPEAKERIVLRLIARAAETGAPCPTNEELRLAIDARSWGSVSRIVTAFEERGIISVERTCRSRQITIMATGKSTASSVLPGKRSGIISAGRVKTARNGNHLDDAAIIAAREAAQAARRERESFWLRKEAEKYGLPRIARPISEMAA